MNYLETIHISNIDDLSFEMVCFINEKLWDGDPIGALYRAGRNYGPQLVEAWFEDGDIDIEDLRSCLPIAWEGVEFPSLALETPFENWLHLFKCAGFVSDDVNATMPTDPIRIYRGATPDTMRHMSWTTDISAAEWFRNRLHDQYGYADATVYTTVIKPRHILALIFDRGESEVVINPIGLKRVSVYKERNV